MSIHKIRRLAQGCPPDDRLLFVKRNDFSGGVNTRQYETSLKENLATVLTNVDIGTPGETRKRSGSVLTANDISDVTFAALHNYERQGYTDVIVGYNDIHLLEWTGTGNWATASASAFGTGNTDVGIISCKESGLTPTDVIIVQNASGTARRFHKDNNNAWTVEDLLDANESPPITTVGCWYGNRAWYLKDDLLYFSDAFPASYASAFDRTTNAFRIPVGAERGLVPTRDTGIIVMGDNQIWGLAPSVVPNASTDKPQPLVTEHGVVSKHGWVNAGDDIYYFAVDGFRALKRTVQDKLQAGISYPLSYWLKTEFEAINWGYISQLSMVYFDNKIFIAVPTGAATYSIWVYYPAIQAFMVIDGWSPRHWCKYKVSGEERLYYAIHGNGAMYRAWNGYTDEGATTTTGTAVTMIIEGRQEDFEYSLQNKISQEIEVIAISESSGNLDIYVSLDGEDYQSIGTLSMTSNAPVLPINLPFTLGNSVKVIIKFPINQLGGFRTLKYKLVEDSINSGDIRVLGCNITALLEEYENK